MAAKIEDPEYRKSFLEEIPETRQTFELARQWADQPRRHAFLGTRWRKIDPAEVSRIMDDTARIARWTCEPARIETDYPQSIVTASRAGRVHRVVHDHGDPCAPDAMLQIEADIDVAGGHPQLVPSVR
jgi:hypothetical protein